MVVARHVARFSSRREPTWRGPRVPPTKNKKLFGFDPLFFGAGQFIFIFFFSIRFYFIFFRSEGRGHGQLAPPPLLRPWLWVLCRRTKRDDITVLTRANGTWSLSMWRRHLPGAAIPKRPTRWAEPIDLNTRPREQGKGPQQESETNVRETIENHYDVYFSKCFI